MISLIADCDDKYDIRAQAVAYKWSRKKLGAALEFPWLSKFLFAVQLLLLDEMKATRALAESSNDEPVLSQGGCCDCRFARSYWLPCRHVILAYKFFGSIEEPD